MIVPTSTESENSSATLLSRFSVANPPPFSLVKSAATACLTLLALLPTLHAQEEQVPRAQPAEDPTLQADPAVDRFELARHQYNNAVASKNREEQQALYERSAALFNDYLAAYPNHENAEASWYYMASSLYQLGRADDARRAYHTVLNRYGRGRYVGSAAYALAVDHYVRKEYAMAAVLFDRTAKNVSRASDRQRALFYQATCYNLLNRDREAITTYTRLIEDNQENSFIDKARLALASLQAKSGKLEEALAAFNLLCQPQVEMTIRGEATLQAGLVALKLKNEALAEKHFRTVLDTPGMETWRADAQVGLMGIRYAAKDYKAVLEIFRATTIPVEGIKEARRLNLAGLAAMKLKRFSDALQWFRDVERLAPPNSDLAFEAAFNRLLCFYEVEGRHVVEQVDGFLEIYQKSRPKDPKIHTALLIKAETLYSQKKIPQAAEAYAAIDVEQITPANRPGMLYQRGWCLAEANDAAGALRSFATFLEQNPKDSRVPDALAKRGEMALALGDNKAALRDFDLLIREHPDSKLAAFAYQKSARLKKDEGDFAGMIQRYRGLLNSKAAMTNETRGNAQYWIGWGLFKQDKFADAIEPLEEARKIDPKTYGRPAGVLLGLSHFSLQASEPLMKEIDQAIKDGYSNEIPEQALRWAGQQAFNASRYSEAARILALGSTPDEPRQTPKIVWRFLGKALLESGSPEKSLAPIENVLAVEDNAQWKADAQLDKARALLALKRLPDAQTAADAGIELQPQGRTKASLRMVQGDIAFARENYDAAAGHYVGVAELVQDRDILPKALDRLIRALEQKGNMQDAERYSKKLRDEFPEYQREKK